MKICPYCKSRKVITFDSDNDWCERCRKYFPSVAPEKCAAGCKAYTGDEIRHHKDCIFYPESFSKRFDALEKALKDMYFAYTNKDGETPHQFEEEAIKQYKDLFPKKIKSDEEEQPKTIEWYKAQVKELMAIRKTYYKLCEGPGGDAYFPDLVEDKLKQLEEIKIRESLNG